MLPLLVVTVINVASVPLFYRTLGPEMYALWFYVLTFTGAFGFMDLGLGVAVGRYIGVALGKGDFEAVREYWGTGNVIAIPLLASMAIAFLLVGVFFGPAWFQVAPANIGLLRWSFVFGGIGLFFSYYGQLWLILSQAHLDFKFVGVLRTAITLLQVIPAIPLAWWTRSPLVLIIWTTSMAALQLAVFFWHARRSYKMGFAFRQARRARALEMAAYTGKTFVTLLVNSLLGTVDRLAIGRLVTAADFTHYAICTNAGTRIQGLSQAVMGPVFTNSSRAVGGGGGVSLSSVYNQAFNFVFPWYVLVSMLVAIWHPVLLRLWLGEELGEHLFPIITPIVVASCLSAISSISSAQLGSLNRIGTGLIFNIATGALLLAGVYFGWRWNGLVGVAWGFLFSRMALLAQDIFVIRLVHADGWLGAGTWRHFCLQLATGLAFSSSALLWPRTSLWQLIPAFAHGMLVAAWVLRSSVRNLALKIQGSFAVSAV